MYVHNSGFRPGYEHLSTHGRRRYRLTTNRNTNTSTAQVDPNLWIVHYYRNEHAHQFPAASIPINEQVRQSLAERKKLQGHGQLVRKEFMLHDRESWPTVNLPGNTASAYPQQAMGYPNNVMAHMSRSQHPAHAQQTQAAVGPSPSKRPRHASSSHVHNVSATAIPGPAKEHLYDEEENTSSNDTMDILTPQDISRHRYVQHHLWLEEVLSSPFDTPQIIPGELGLGRKGELESLTRDFFDAPTGGTPAKDLPYPTDVDAELAKAGTPVVHDIPAPRVGRMDAGMADDFTKRATNRVAQISAEMEKLKKQHAKRMAKLNSGRLWKEAEQNIRVETLELIGDVTKVVSGQQATAKLAKDMEFKLGKHIKSIEDVECNEKGGLEEKTQASRDIDMDHEMGDTTGDLNALQPQAPSETEPLNPASLNHLSHTNPPTQGSSVQGIPIPTAEVVSTAKVSSPHKAKDAGTEDWVMVDKDGESTIREREQDQSGFGSFTNDSALLQPNINETIGDDLRDPEEAVEADAGLNFDDHDFGGGIDFGDLDTAGNELSGYAHEIENMEAGEQESLDMGGDTFGSAFHNTGDIPEQGGPPGS